MAGRIIHAKSVFDKSKTHTVKQLDAVGNTWQVTSGESGKHYVVRVQREKKLGRTTYAGARCSCPWGQYRPSRTSFRSGCSHTQAVYDCLIDQEQGRSTSAWSDPTDADRQHRPVVSLGDGVWLTTRKRERVRSAAAVALFGDGEGEL
ncbi:MAG: hypothetical protein ACYSVY_00120 [Planctomycetota bacterium]|jgi:hypothetical protein